jgi:hypothetical protein
MGYSFSLLLLLQIYYLLFLMLIGLAILMTGDQRGVMLFSMVVILLHGVLENKRQFLAPVQSQNTRRLLMLLLR